MSFPRLTCWLHFWWLDLSEDTFWIALVCGKCGW